MPCTNHLRHGICMGREFSLLHCVSALVLLSSIPVVVFHSGCWEYCSSLAMSSSWLLVHRCHRAWWKISLDPWFPSPVLVVLSISLFIRQLPYISGVCFNFIYPTSTVVQFLRYSLSSCSTICLCTKRTFWSPSLFNRHLRFLICLANVTVAPVTHSICLR